MLAGCVYGDEIGQKEQAREGRDLGEGKASPIVSKPDSGNEWNGKDSHIKKRHGGRKGNFGERVQEEAINCAR